MKQQGISFLGTAIISLFFLLGDIPAILLINRIGRRPMVIWSFAIMALGLLIVGVFSRIGSFVGTFLVPFALNSIGIGTTVLTGAGLTVFGCILSVAMAPETTGKTLQEASMVGHQV